MADQLRSRGPDDEGYWNDPETNIALAHRRLSILDLSPAGHQPMDSACGRYIIVYNGEIYNHLELRKELEQQGAVTAWRGHSDTETLLASIAHWGPRVTLQKCVGMFAFALWDRQERVLMLARDRFGEKPLYYGWSNGAFLFASELAALQKYPGFDNTIDPDVLSLYFQFSYVPTPYSIYERIYKLEAGCLLTAPLASLSTPLLEPLWPGLTSSSGICIKRYWSFEEAALSGLADPIVHATAALEALEHQLQQTVTAQMISDVPLGAFLSGGIDSSTIVALMQALASKRVKTYSIGFEEAGFNEAVYAKDVAKHLGTEHTELYVSSQDALDVIPALPRLYSEPFADSSQIPTHLVAKLAADHVTVALSGDGGDELFGGYDRYLWGPRIWNRIGFLPASMRRAMGVLIGSAPSLLMRSFGEHLPTAVRVTRLDEKMSKLAARLSSADTFDNFFRGLVTEWPANSAVVRGARPQDTLLDRSEWVQKMPRPEARMMAWDTLTYMTDDILHKVDRAAMGVSLETRVPFLDHRLVELAWRIPVTTKFCDGKGKWPLRQILSKYVPAELINRPKAGFALPIGEWLRGPLRDWSDDLLAASSLDEVGYLNTTIIRQKWQKHRSGSRDWTAALWSVLMYQAWNKSIIK